MRNVYQLDRLAKRRLHDRSYRAQQNGHFEVCGALVLYQENRLELWFLKNYSNREGSFEVDLVELRETRQAARSSGKRVVGLFHSHPVGEAIPGKRDINQCPVNGLLLIYDVCGRDLKLWRVLKKGRSKFIREIAVGIV